MRIGIDVRLWSQTGVGRYTRNLVENLSLIDKKNSYTLFARSEDKVNLSNENWKVVKTDIRWHSFNEQIAFLKILNRQNLDLVHFPYFSHPVFYNKPFVITIHDLITNSFDTGKASTLPLPFYRVKRAGYKMVINHAINSSKKIIVPTNFVKNELIEKLKVPTEKISVTYEGIDEGIKNGNKINTYGKYFLYVGNAFPHKNLDKLIEAFKIFKKSHKNIKLLLVGKEDFFYKIIKQKETGSSILFLNHVSDENLSTLYKNAISLISASLMEGFGLPIIEAMANNCPVTISDIAAFKELCGSLALYFNPLDVNDIAAKMEEVYKINGKFYDKKQEELRIRLNQFNWEKTAKETLDVYESCFSLR